MLGELYKKSIEKIIMPIGDKIAGGHFLGWLQMYREEQWLSESELKSIQQERLSRVLHYVTSHVPFYKDLTCTADPLIAIKQFPILTKSTIKSNIGNLTAGTKERLIAESGSGSSGIQGTVYMDRSAQASQRALQMLWFEWSGYRAGDSVLQTGITPHRGFIKGMKDRFLDTEYIPAFNLDASSINFVLEKLTRRPRHFLFGYASSLYLIAQAAQEAKMTDLSFKYAVSWGDKLFPHYRNSIRNAFGCETLDTYGCTEGAMIAAQCPYGTYHLSINQCFLEIVDDDGLPVLPGQIGKVVVTRLDNFAMPLIRYYLGDLAVLAPPESPKCACGRKLPMLEKIIGRDTDIIRTRSGKQMIVHFFTGIFEHIVQIQQFMVVQKTLDCIDIHYIPGPGFHGDVLQKIEALIHSKLNEKFPINWVRTSRIQNTPSGKPQIVQSFVKQSLHH